MTTTIEFTKADLPELPEKITVHTVMPDDGWYGNVKAYDHFQMRAYALAAVAACRKKLMEQQGESAADACSLCGGRGTITVWSDSSPDAHRVDVDCDHCRGTGAAFEAASNLACLLADEKRRHLELFRVFQNFHRSLCARFGYSHDLVHFRRDLVSLEEFIAAKLAAPMPQANESEAVKALRALVYGCDFTVGQISGKITNMRLFVPAIERARAMLAGEPGAQAEQQPRSATKIRQVIDEFAATPDEAARLAEMPLHKAVRALVECYRNKATQTELPKQAQAEQPRDESLPERNPEEPAERQGLFRKFDVRHVDGSDQPGGKHHGCRYFVLDVDHDTHAITALTAYAASCETAYPDLARDLREKWGALEQPKKVQAMDEREAFHIWFSGYIDPNSGPAERNVKRLPAWHAWQARAALDQAQASGEHCQHPTECFDHTKGLLCDDCLGKPRDSGKATPAGELE